MITRSEHSFGPGKAETTLVGRWVAQRWNNTEEARASIPTGSTTVDANTSMENAQKCQDRKTMEGMVEQDPATQPVGMQPVLQ